MPYMTSSPDSTNLGLEYFYCKLKFIIFLFFFQMFKVVYENVQQFICHMYIPGYYQTWNPAMGNCKASELPF